VQEDESFSKGCSRKPERGDHTGQVAKDSGDREEHKGEQQEGGDQI